MQQDYICKKNLLKLVESVNTHIYGCDCQVANKFSVFSDLVRGVGMIERQEIKGILTIVTLARCHQIHDKPTLSI
jgi:hypothetical protein